MIAPYVLAACQPKTQIVFGADKVFRPDLLDANVDHYCALIAQAAREHDARLIVFPQFGLTGYAMGLSIDDWIQASLTFPGPHLERLGAAAKAAGAHVVVHATEAHPAFPGRYFSTAALITPDGALGLVYRKNYVLTTRTRPIDVHDAFVAAFGPDSFFPVADTALGRIGVVIAAEVHWPEATRSLGLKGAEVILNPTGTAPLIDYMSRPGAAAARSVRAFENVAYLAMANIGANYPPDGEAGGTPEGSAPPSEIYDYNGALIATGPRAADAFALAVIDIEALRTARTQPSANFIAQLQPDVHHDPAAAALLWPANAFADQPVAEPRDLTQIEDATWLRLVAAGRAAGPQSD